MTDLRLELNLFEGQLEALERRIDAQAPGDPIAQQLLLAARRRLKGALAAIRSAAARDVDLPPKHGRCAWCGEADGEHLGHCPRRRS